MSVCFGCCAKHVFNACLLSWQPKHDKMAIEHKYAADVVVVGAGVAGIAAVIELLDHGKRVILLDRDEKENIGGLARWAFGGLFFVNSKTQRKAGIRDSVDLAWSDWKAFAQYDDEEIWGPRWAEQFIHFTTPHGYDWLTGMGIRFFPVLNWAERGLFQPGNSVPRFHLLWGTGYELARVLSVAMLAHVKAGNLQCYFGHRVTDILLESGAVVGVSGTDEGRRRPFVAHGEQVIIASGGINGSIERVKANWPGEWGSPPEIILNGSHPFGIGDLHDAAQRQGAHVTYLDRQWNYAAGVHHPRPRMPQHGLSLVPCKSALWLNYRGQRMGPLPLVTAFDTRYLVERICQEERKYSWQVLNRKIAYKEFAISGSEHNPAARDKKLPAFLLTVLLGNRALVKEMIETCEDFVIADSLEELAEKMNALNGDEAVDVNQLSASVRQYDQQIERGKKYHNDDQLRRIAHARQYRGDRLRTCAFQKIDDRSARPLIAIREFILSRKTLGGIQTDLDCRVLSSPVEGKQPPIPGLYAVGESAGFGGGGMHGRRSLEGTFLAGCVITGRTAARAIVGRPLSA
jgi:predicted oxidoreductase